MDHSNDAARRGSNGELLRASENGCRLITDNVADVIWTCQFAASDLAEAVAGGDAPAAVDAMLDHWRFSLVGPAVPHILGYTPDEARQLSLRDVIAPASQPQIRQAMVDAFFLAPSEAADDSRQHVFELELLTKDGGSRWYEVRCRCVCDDSGLPWNAVGVARDLSQRRRTEHALRESEERLRSLLENLPDLVLVVDRGAVIQFANRDAMGVARESLLGACVTRFGIPEHREAFREALAQAFAAGLPQACELQDVFSQWWSIRLVPIASDAGIEHSLVICTNSTVERVAAEAVKEQRLLQQLLELHERERQLTAYDIHDGFAQQLAGAMYRLQAFRENFVRNPEEAWKSFDSSAKLLAQAIHETRRLISGLRPPILDESGILEAIRYLVCEHRQQGGPDIEFEHDVSFSRLAPPLESALFRIVQESLQNACRHSRSERIRVTLVQNDGRIHLDIQDWGIGFNPEAVAEQRFGLQGIRERVRLLEGSVTLHSAPAKGTLISVELPLVEAPAEPAAGDDFWDY